MPTGYVLGEQIMSTAGDARGRGLYNIYIYIYIYGMAPSWGGMTSYNYTSTGTAVFTVGGFWCLAVVFVVVRLRQCLGYS